MPNFRVVWYVIDALTFRVMFRAWDYQIACNHAKAWRFVMHKPTYVLGERQENGELVFPD
jgi:hypothetical protein